MSKLVRARVRAVEYLPGWAKCCETGLQTRLALPDMLLDINDYQHLQKGDATCRFCGHPQGNTTIVRDVADGDFVSLDLVDLDEVPAELQSDKYVDSLEVERA